MLHVFLSVMLQRAMGAQIHGNPEMRDQVGLVLPDICIFICEFSVRILLHVFVVASVFFRWLPNFLSTCI